MKIKDIMTRAVETVRPDASIAEAAEKMERLDVGPLPVCDGDTLLGMVTDRDLTVRATATGQDPTRTTVQQVMTPDVVYCFEDQNVREAA